MFPSLASNLQLKQTEPEKIQRIGKSFRFDFKQKRFVFEDGKNVQTTELQAIEQWIELCLRTYKDKYKVYKGETFGTNIEDLIGQKLNSFVKSELDREVRESLLKSVQIKEIIKTNYTQEHGTTTIDVEVKLRDGSIIRKVV